MDVTEVSSRDRIINAAARLLAEGGREIVSIRAIIAAAGVQAPTIYRHFGDMRGLLDAVASQGFTAYLHSKVTREAAQDPVEDLRLGWDLHVEFGLTNPALYMLMYGDPRPESATPAAVEAQDVLHLLVRRVAEAGRLRMSVKQAAGIISATGIGVTLSLIGTRLEERDPELSSMTREAVLGVVTLGSVSSTRDPDTDILTSRAAALLAVLPTAQHRGGFLSPGEQLLLSEWLERLSWSVAP